MSDAGRSGGRCPEDGDDRSAGITRRAALKTVSGAILASSPLLSIACGGSGTAPTRGVSKGGVLTVALTETTQGEGLDPALSNVTSMYVRDSAMYETLVYLDPDGWQLKPMLAESWESNSKLDTWQFKLRKGVTFHNGKPLTAEDVVYSVGRLLDSKSGSQAQSRLVISMKPDSLKAVGDDTVEIRLTRPDSLLPYFLGFSWCSIIPAGSGPIKTVAQAIGTGPYKLKSWQQAQSWEVVANPDYWGSGAPYLDSIRAVIVSEQAAKISGVQSGSFQLAEAIPFASAKSLSGKGGSVKVLPFKKIASPNITMAGAHAPFSDNNVRMAAKLAVDRDLVLENAYHGFGEVTADLPIGPSDPYYPPGLGVRKQDPEQARHLLAKAGFANGLDMTLFTSDVFAGMPEFALAYSQSAKAAGVNATVKNWPPATYWDKIWTQRPMYTAYSLYMFPPEQIRFNWMPGAYVTKDQQVIKQFTTLFDQILRAADEKDRLRLTQDAYRLQSEQGGYISPAVSYSPWLAASKLDGLVGIFDYRVNLANARFTA
jgi:peptide/nickel transport system substrate-binding protein